MAQRPRRSRWRGEFARMSASLSVSGLILTTAAPASNAADEWGAYGHDPGGQRFSPLRQLDRANVAKLELAWAFHIGDVSDGRESRRSGLETTPLFLDGRLYLTTPFNRVIALNPETGQQLWAYDPRVDRSAPYGDGLINRGVAAWRAPSGQHGCKLRLFEATLDARLLALDAATGRPCTGFGRDGQVSPAQCAELQARRLPYDIAPDGGRRRGGRRLRDRRQHARGPCRAGVVRGYDARTGALRWSWDPLPPEAGRRSGGCERLVDHDGRFEAPPRLRSHRKREPGLLRGPAPW